MTMLKLRCTLLRAVGACQKQLVNTSSSPRKLHSLVHRTNPMQHLPDVFCNRFRRTSTLLKCGVIGMHFPRHWESTSSALEMDMNKDVYCVRVNVCAELYSHWYDMDVNRRMPLNGIDFDVVYFDSEHRAPSHVPVILALHGTAGSHLNFAPLIPILRKSGARIIMPNFPGCGFTTLDEGKTFLHTDQERASFVMNFLNSLGVSRVDVLVVHSAAIYPALYCLNNMEVFKSFVMLNPAGHKPVKALQPLWLYQIAVTLLGNRLFRPFARSLMPLFAPNMKLGFEQLEIAGRSLVFVNFDFMVQALKDLRMSNFPMIFSYGMNDHMVGAKIFEEMTQILEYSPQEIVRYNAEGQPVQPQIAEIGNRYPPCIIFEDGDHFVMQAYPEIVGKAITDLLEWTKSRAAVTAYT